MAKKLMKTKNGFVVIPLTKPYLIEGNIIPKGTKLLVEEEGVIDTIQTNADIASASAGDFEELYDKANMRRLRKAMEGDIDSSNPEILTMEDELTPEEKLEMRRRIARMEGDDEEEKLEMRRKLRRLRRIRRMDQEEEEKNAMDDDENSELATMRRIRLARMKRRMDQEEEEKNAMDDEERKEMIRARMRQLMKRRMDQEEEKDKMDDEEKEEDNKE